MRTDTEAEPATPTVPPTQGDLSTLDERTDQDAIALRRQMSGAEDVQDAAPLIWGSIRVLAVYGKWSWWRKTKPKKRP
jgi:hypothetical protein